MARFRTYSPGRGRGENARKIRTGTTRCLYRSTCTRRPPRSMSGSPSSPPDHGAHSPERRCCRWSCCPRRPGGRSEGLKVHLPGVPSGVPPPLPHTFSHHPLRPRPSGDLHVPPGNGCSRSRDRGCRSRFLSSNTSWLFFPSVFLIGPLQVSRRLFGCVLRSGVAFQLPGEFLFQSKFPSCPPSNEKLSIEQSVLPPQPATGGIRCLYPTDDPVLFVCPAILPNRRTFTRTMDGESQDPLPANPRDQTRRATIPAEPGANI